MFDAAVHDLDIWSTIMVTRSNKNERVKRNTGAMV